MPSYNSSSKSEKIGKESKPMYKIEAAVRLKQVSRQDLANATGKTTRTIQYKLVGKYPFTVPEALKIKEAYFPEASIEDLFCRPVII